MSSKILDNARLCMINNSSERALHGLALGKV
jgi:hypothetical protein